MLLDLNAHLAMTLTISARRSDALSTGGTGK